MEKIIMSKKELEQIAVLEQLKNKEITQASAAEMLHLGVRQVRNKLKIFRNEGPKGLAHKNRGRPSPRKWSPEEEKVALELFKGPIWHDFGPTFAAEKLQELYDIKINRETLRQSMIAHGLWKPLSPYKKKRKRRERRRLFGSMVQLDGSPHKWFGQDYYTLLVFIDDATSRLVHLELVKSESFESVMRATRKYIEAYGRPMAIYVDFGSVFRVNLNNQNHEKLSQWERAMKDLGIEVIHAHSPQAKGRVERSHGTHQDRLVKEFRLAGVTTLEAANDYLKGYMEKHNRMFACQPAEETDAHRTPKGFDLDSILCWHEPRKVQNDYTIQYQKRIFQLCDKRNIVYKPQDPVLIKELLNGSIVISLRGYNLEYEELEMRPPKQPKEKVYNNAMPRAVQASKRWNNHLLFKKKPYYYQPRVY